MNLKPVETIVKYLPELWKYAKEADSIFGVACPKCNKSSWLKQKKVGKTFFTDKVKIRCGECGKVFVVS